MEGRHVPGVYVCGGWRGRDVLQASVQGVLHSKTAQFLQVLLLVSTTIQKHLIEGPALVNISCDLAFFTLVVRNLQ